MPGIAVRTLLVEDCEEDAGRLLDELRRGGLDPTWRRVETREALLEALAAETWDVVLADQSLPDFSALGALRAVQASGVDVPVLVVSGTIDAELAVEMMRNGAADYVPKSNLGRLAAAIQRERKSAEERRARRLAEQRELQELALRDRAIQAVSQGILITDACLPDNPIIFASPGFERMTGYSKAEVLGRNCRFLQGKDTDGEAVRRVREAVSAGRAITEVLLNYRKDGKPFWNELFLSPVRNEQGQLTHFVGVQVDITARRQLEEQYHQVQKMDAMGQLAAGVAHDFNNLLTVINGYSDLMLDTLAPGDTSRELLATIRRAGDRSAGLTRQLLTFSRQHVNRPRVLNLNELIVNLQRMLQRIIGEDVELTTVLEPGLGSIHADPGQLEQVIMNLAVNARDAMPQGGRLTIETANVDLDASVVSSHLPCQAGQFVRLAMTDTGTGMTPEVRERAFEPFFTTKAAGKGTGLGLAVVHGIVTQSHGFITVKSEPGDGARFEAHFSRLEPMAPAVRPAHGRVAPPQGAETVLLVEDDDVVRAFSLHVLKACGYDVVDACGPDEAFVVALKHSKPVQLLVTDVVMPGMGGRLLAEQIVELYPDARVLYVSGYTDDAVMRHGILHQQMAFLQKPYSPLALAQKVREVLDATVKGG